MATSNPNTVTSKDKQQVPNPSAFLEQGANAAITANPVDIGAMWPKINELRTYDRMIRSDAQVRTSLMACKIPVLTGTWYIEPASDDTQDQDIGEFVDFNLFQNMTVSWSRLLEQIARMLDYGCSSFEQVFEHKRWRNSGPNRNTRDMIMLRKLGERPRLTIDKFLYDENGGPAGFLHNKIDPTGKNPPTPVTIPIEKAVIFVFDQHGSNLDGMSILRSAYKHWYMKEHFYNIDGIQKERHGIGIPDIQPPPGYNENDLKYAQDLGRNLRTNQKAYIIRPPGWFVGFAEVKGNLVNVLESAVHHDLMIARNVLLQFINAGATSSSGSRANSATAYDLFLKSLEHVANIIADTINAYVIPNLVRYNYDVDRFPKLSFRGIGDAKDIQTIGSGLARLVDARLLTPDAELEEKIREEFGYPTTFDTADPRNKVVPKEAVQQEYEGVTPPTDGGTTPGGSKPSTGNVPKHTQDGGVSNP
jgi:hypothetical protein